MYDMVKAQNNADVYADALQDRLDLAKVRLIDFAFDTLCRRWDEATGDFVPVTYNGETGLASANGILLQLDVEELIYTGDLLLHVVHTARKCCHRALTLFEGFGREYAAPKRCPRCKAVHKALKLKALEAACVAAGEQ